MNQLAEDVVIFLCGFVLALLLKVALPYYRLRRSGSFEQRGASIRIPRKLKRKMRRGRK